MSLIPVGPYLFTDQDARKTLLNAPIILEMMRNGRDPNPVAHLADRVDTLLRDVDVLKLPSDEVPELLAQVWATVAAASLTLRVGGHAPAIVSE